jgi:hypothetical protein
MHLAQAMIWGSLITQAISTASVLVCRPVAFQVSVTAQNTKFAYPPDPNNETAILAFFANSTANAPDGTQTVGGTYTIHGTYCAPLAGARNALQILVHGTTYNKTYWTGFGIAETYDYPGYASSQGYHTLAIDRLGHGDNTQHPDPVNYLQAPLHLAVIHQIITSVRAKSSILGTSR